MYDPYYAHYPRRHRAYPSPGLIGVLGSMLGVAVVTLQGGARVVRTVVEQTMWYEAHNYDPCGYPGPCGSHYGQCAHHCYEIDCRPHCGGYRC